MALNFDKTAVGLLILLLVARSARRLSLSRSDLRWTVGLLAMLIAAILPAAVWSGYVAFEPKWPAGSWAWALNNLFFVCLAEEALYRGFLLEMLLRYRPGRRGWIALALCVSSFVFGLAHYRHGSTNIALATLAGLFYGGAYVKSRRVHASMLVHFGLNLVHFAFFTYPALSH